MSAKESVDLIAGIPELMARLSGALDEGQWTDAFLLAAGVVQIAEDRLQGASSPPRRLVRCLRLRPGVELVNAVSEAASGLPPVRGLLAWTTQMAGLTDALADHVVGGEPPDPPVDVRQGVHRAAIALGRAPGGSRILSGAGALLRPPACFCGFDQHPQDVTALVHRFVEAWPDRERPLLVVGVRTSGSYLGPLTAAALRRAGYRRVRAGTTRPGQVLLPGRRAQVRAVREAGGLVLVVDDPPVTGGSLAEVAARAEQAGFPSEAVVPLFACFEDSADQSAGALARYPCVTLPGSAWHVHERLAAPALGDLLAEALPPGRRLVGLRTEAPGRLSRRAHLAVPVTATVRIEGTSDGAGAVEELPLVAEWAGIGYLGYRAVNTAAELEGLVPRVYAFADGVLLRERPAGEEGHEPDRVPVDAAEVARYVAARQERFTAAEDRSLQLAGREPVWEMAARALAPAFGRLRLVLRPALLHPLLRSLLAAEQPCVVDGRTAPERWVADAAGRWIKTDFAEGAFSNLNLAGYDAAYDLAGAAAGGLDAGQLLDEYQKLTGRRVDAPRWCLLRLVQAGNLGERTRVRRAQSAAVRQFLAETYLSDLAEPPADGPWCVLDVDGVLETDVLGFPIPSPRGMLALRTLRAHGCRTLIASGRSLPEVQERCRDYRLPGGVAEYGAAIFATASGKQSSQHVHGDGGLRNRLAALPGVELDPLFRWCVRASVVDSTRGGRRNGLPPGTVAAVLNAQPKDRPYVAVPGDAQTDFVPRGTDKARGVRALLDRLGDADAVPLLAVGDGIADLPLLRWARYGAAPGNAAPELRTAGVPVARRGYQAGLADTVARLVGHPPGGCPRCRAPRQTRETAAMRALLALFAVPEAGRTGMPVRIAELAAAVVLGRGRPQ